MIRLLRRRRTSRRKLFHSPLNPFFLLVVFLRSDEFSTFRQNNKMRGWAGAWESTQIHSSFSCTNFFTHPTTLFCLFLLFRAEIKILHQGVSPKREKLTEWLSSSIAELRTEVAELQSTAANLTRSCHQRNLIGEEMRSVHNEMSTFKLELSAIRARQDKSEALLRELRDEMIQGSGAEELGNGVNAKQRKVRLRCWD